MTFQCSEKPPFPSFLPWITHLFNDTYTLLQKIDKKSLTKIQFVTVVPTSEYQNKVFGMFKVWCNFHCDIYFLSKTWTRCLIFFCTTTWLPRWVYSTIPPTGCLFWSPFTPRRGYVGCILLPPPTGGNTPTHRGEQELFKTQNSFTFKSYLNSLLTADTTHQSLF